MASQTTRSPVRVQTQSSDNNLTTTDLPRLCNHLYPAASKFYDIGLQLEVERHEIINIESNYSKCERRLSEILANRLNQVSPLTWPDIVAALRSNAVKESALANEIEDEFIKPSNCTSLQSVPSAHDQHAISSTSGQPTGQPQMLLTIPQRFFQTAHDIFLSPMSQFVEYVKANYELNVLKWQKQRRKVILC